MNRSRLCQHSFAVLGLTRIERCSLSKRSAAILILGLRLIPLAPVMEYLVFRVQADVYDKLLI